MIRTREEDKDNKDLWLADFSYLILRVGVVWLLVVVVALEFGVVVVGVVAEVELLPVDALLA